MTDFGSIATPVARVLAHSLWQGGVVLLAYLMVRRFARLEQRGGDARTAAIGVVVIALLPLLTGFLTWYSRDLVPPAGTTAPAAIGAVALPSSMLRLMQQRLNVDVARWIAALWLAGALVMTVAIGLGAWWLNRRVRRRGRVIQVPGLALLSCRAGLAMVPEVREWDGAGSPFVTGWPVPVIVLPRRLDRMLGRDEFEAILVHELAHVARRDVASNLLLRLLGALAWYQLPLRVFFRDLERARERSCDALAVRAMGERLPLARALVRLEEGRAGRPRLVMAGTGGDFSTRVRRILAGDPAGPVRHAGARLAVAALLTVSVTTLLLAASAEETVRRWVGSVHARITAEDPAGPFTVELIGSRLVAATVDGELLSAERIRQEGTRVALLDRDGKPELLLTVDAPGGIRWKPRPPRSP